MVAQLESSGSVGIWLLSWDLVAQMGCGGSAVDVVAQLGSGC